MNITRTISTLALLALVAPFGAQAAALYGSSSSSSSAAVVVDVGADTSVSSDDNDMATGSPSQGSAGDDSNMNGSGSVQGSAMLRTNALGVAVVSSSQVTSDQDLDAYTANLRTNDSMVAEADISGDDHVALDYWHTGRVFGIFPVKVKTHTLVSHGAGGELSVKAQMPWWNLFVMDTERVSSSIESELSRSEQVSADMKMAANAQARARVLEAILNANMQARVSAE